MKIVIIGEICKDEFVYGKITRLCPEAPVPVFNPLKVVENYGMSGNVLENVKSILKVLNEDCEIFHWHQPEEIRKKRIVDEKSNQMIVRIDEGENSKISQFNLSKSNQEIIIKADLVIVSDYAKGFLSDSDLIEIGKLSKLSILDSKRKLSKEIVNSYTYVKLNESESLVNKDLLEDFDNIIITMGGKGVKLNGFLYEQEDSKETIDVSGAGDTFVSAFGIMYFKTRDIAISLMYANKVAGIVVSKRGVSVPFT